MAIVSFKNKSLEELFFDGTEKGINSAHADKLLRRLDKLDSAKSPKDMNLPGYRLHLLEPKKNGRYAIDVSGAWRLTFEFNTDGDAIKVDYEQYH